MKKIPFIILYFVTICWASVTSAIDKEKIVVGADIWIDYVEPDGSGIYLELLYSVYGEENIELKLMPFNRVIDDFNKGKIDIALGVFRDEIDDALFPQWYLDVEYPLAILYLKEDPKIEKVQDLNDRSVGWFKGYDYGKYIPDVKTTYPLSQLSTGFEMMMNDRLDMILDFEYNIPKEYRDKIAVYELIPERYIFTAFQKNLYGKKLAKIYDRKMMQLRSAGTLANIFGKEYSHTRFEDFDPTRKNILMYTSEANVFHKRNLRSTEPSNRTSSTLNIIFDQLINYHIEYKLMSDFSRLDRVMSHEFTCFSDMIKTPERAKRFLFSKPFSLYLGLELHSNKPLPIDSPVKLDELGDYIDDYKLGRVKGRSYGQSIDRQLEELNKKNVIDIPGDIQVSTKLLAYDKYEFTIDYPEDIYFFWKGITDKELYSYPIKGADPYVAGHFMCTNTESGRAFIKQIDLVLDVLNEHNRLYNHQQRFISPTHKQTFEQYFEQAIMKYSANKKDNSTRGSRGKFYQ